VFPELSDLADSLPFL